MENLTEKVIYKDYSKKLKNKLGSSEIKETDINEFVALLNYCFQKKNNFFIENFNKRVIKNVYLSYNQIKTNILTPTINDVFENINHDNLKLLRFIVANFINNFELISSQDNDDLCAYVSKDSMKRCLQYFTSLISQSQI
jgi:hypothetical protein